MWGRPPVSKGKRPGADSSFRTLGRNQPANALSQANQYTRSPVSSHRGGVRISVPRFSFSSSPNPLISTPVSPWWAQSKVPYYFYLKNLLSLVCFNSASFYLLEYKRKELFVSVKGQLATRMHIQCVRCRWAIGWDHLLGHRGETMGAEGRGGHYYFFPRDLDGKGAMIWAWWKGSFTWRHS